MRNLVQQRFEKFLLAMLDGHRERNADRVTSLIIITARRAIAKNDFRQPQRSLEMLPIDSVKCSMRLSYKPA